MSEWGPGLAALLGLVEGLTEFLPVSSTGHLIILGHWLGFTGPSAVGVEMMIQLGAILAVLMYERHRMASILVQAMRERVSLREAIRRSKDASELSMQEGWSYLLYRSSTSHPNLWFLLGLAIAFMPAAAVGVVVRDWVQSHLFNPVIVGVALIAGGLAILVVEAKPSPPRITDLGQVNFMTAIWIGLAQCLALIPGVSRPGATIVAGLLAGMNRRVATEYSFFLAVPTMVAATTYQFYVTRDILTRADLLALALGLAVSFLVGWAVIAAFLTFLKRHTLRSFAYYRILLGLAVLRMFG